MLVFIVKIVLGKKKNLERMIFVDNNSFVSYGYVCMFSYLELLVCEIFVFYFIYNILVKKYFKNMGGGDGGKVRRM